MGHWLPRRWYAQVMLQWFPTWSIIKENPAMWRGRALSPDKSVIENAYRKRHIYIYMCTRVNTCLWYRSTLSTRPSSLFYTYMCHLWSEGIRVFNYSYIPDFQIFFGFYLCAYRSVECYNHSNAGALNSKKKLLSFFLR